MKNYIQELFTAIDDARANPNDHSELGHEIRTPTDRHTAAMNRQTKRAELWQAIIDYREERLSEEDLYMFFQSFEKGLTYYDFIRVLAHTEGKIL